jgi:hypothetical protein
MQETVSKPEFRSIRVGQSRTFTLSDRRKVRSVRVQASSMKDEDMEFSVNKGCKPNVVRITRNK